MMRPRSLGRRMLDLTPLLDVIMIFLFGAMINSVELMKKSSGEAKEPPPKLEAAALDKEALDRLEGENRRLSQALDRERNEKAAVSEAMVRVLGLNREQREALEARLKRLAADNPEEVAAALKDIQSNVDVADVYKAIRRIQEMQKVFTFVDMHLDDNDFLSIRVDGRDLEKVSARERSTETIESDLRRLLESVRFSDVVLFTFSYANARDRSREEAERAINRTLAAYRQDASHRGRQFRLGRIGLLNVDPGPNKEGRR